MLATETVPALVAVPATALALPPQLVTAVLPCPARVRVRGLKHEATSLLL